MSRLTQVKLTPQPLVRYRELLGPAFDPVLKAAEVARESLTGRVIWNVNSTARGGGVAEMLYAYLPYVLDSGVDTRWMVIQPRDLAFFAVTKRMHNRFHGSPGDGGPLGPLEREVYDESLSEIASEFASRVSSRDVVILHDPQTAGLIPAIKSTGATVVWRCHIGIDEPNEIALETQEFLSGLVGEADRCVFSRAQYVWPVLEPEKVAVIPPGIDAFTPKNQPMEESTLNAVLGQIGLGESAPASRPVFVRADGSIGEVSRTATIRQDCPLPDDAPLVAQISRWDRLKDHLGLLTAFGRDMTHDSAHLALVGPDTAGVDDDPEGAAVYAEIEEAWDQLPARTRQRVHLVSLPMEDLEENAFIVNALQRRADVIVQKSLAEGFGLTVSEGMWKSRPVVASRLGGIMDQIEDGVSGLLIDDARDLPAFAKAIDGLLENRSRSLEIGQSAQRKVTSGLLSVQRLVRHFELIHGLEQSSSPPLLEVQQSD